MPDALKITARVNVHPEQEGAAPSEPFPLQVVEVAPVTAGFTAQQAEPWLIAEREFFQTRWDALIEALPEAGEPGGWAELLLEIEGAEALADVLQVQIGAGEHWDTLPVDPVEIIDGALHARLELELDKAGQWAGRVILIAQEPKEPVDFAAQGIQDLQGCAGLPPLRHILWRVRAGATLSYARLDASSDAWNDFDGRRALLFLHGTGLNARKTLDYMQESSDGLVTELVRAYGGRVLAFNHATVTSTIPENLAELNKLWPRVNPVTGKPMTMEVDVLGVSRGGLLARYIVEGHGLIDGPTLTVRNVVFLGTPHEGTWSAMDNNKWCVIGVRCLCNKGATKVYGPPVGDPIVKGVIGIGQPGQLNMQPHSALLNDMNLKGPDAEALRALQPDMRYHAVCSTFWLPEDHSSRPCVEKMFGAAENDLVVPVGSVFDPKVTPASRFEGLLPIPQERRLHFQPADQVTHVDYINQPRVHEQLRVWLEGDGGLV
ncbi:MAG: hypothetical protein H6739_21900 [Alphaproteobacteria bacterium]|nr:hypothetical protein [Alphaproteobacteria bacterium]